MKWAIYSVRDGLWWSNEDGWVDKASATPFTYTEKCSFAYIPFGGVWKQLNTAPRLKSI